MSDLRRLSDDIESEISDHLERRVRDLREAGMTAAAARERARAEFGDLSAARRDLLAIDARITTRRQRGRVWSGLASDIRTGTRRLAGQSGPTALTILTLALAIGFAAAVFSIVDQLILRPPPFIHADRLVNVRDRSRPDGVGGGGLLGAEKILGWQQQPAVFERLEAYIGAFFDLTESAAPERVSARVVSLGLIDMLGIRMHIGRPFAEGDGAPGSEKVAILSHGFWTSRFGGSPSTLGSPIVLNDERYTIIGVLARGTTLLSDDESVWLPVDLSAWGAGAPSSRFLAIGRLNAGLDASETRERANVIAAELVKSTPLADTWYLGIDEMRSASLTLPTRQTLYVLLGAVTLLLLIACVNVTSFALGQTLRRDRELRLRAAIGAGRWRLLRECLVETMLLAVAAGLAAALIAQVALDVLLAAAPDGLAFMTTRTVEIDVRVLAVMTAVTLTTGLLAGLLPGIRASRVDLPSALRDGARGSERGLSFGAGIGALVVAEVALAMVLLVGATLMSRTLIAYHALEPGFDIDKVMTAQLFLPTHRYPTEQARRDFFDALDAALRRQRGIEASAHAWGLPPAAGSLSGVLQAEAKEPLSGEQEYFANRVSPTYFETTGTRLLAGRVFTPADADDHVILSEAFARLLWRDEPAVGRRLREGSKGPWLTVVGVAGNVESRWDAAQRSDLQVYYPLALDVPAPDRRPGRSYMPRMLIVRASDLALVPAAVREQVRLLDPLQPVATFSSGAEIYTEPFAQQQFLLTVMGAFAGIALLLAAMGIFGVLSQAVTRRRREIGIRIALGAGSRRLISMLVGRGLALAAAGAAIGTGASLAGVRTLEGLLFGVSPFDAVSFVLVVGLILAVALVACWWPTSRALAVDPADVLRSE
ncbi:MAG: ADOP family duplicated permease [Vicinamibacterales bacterium]